MSKPGVNNTPMKQDNNPFKKDNRGPNNPNMKDDKSFTSPNNRSNSGQGHGHQQNQSHNRDRSGNRNDNRQFDKSGPESSKSNDKDDKNSTDTPGASGEKKFTGRCRLFVGNLTPDVTEDDFRKMFEPYGEISEVYVNTSRGFGFIRLDYRQNAEAAKAALDGLQRKGRILRVRFATHGAALKVKNLHPFVSNELLEQSFSQFGELERCVVIVDDRGKATGEGIVEFVRKPGASSALRRITEGVFLIGADPKPVAVEPLEQKDEEDGMPEKFLTKTDQYKKEREKEPRFAPPGTFEYEFGMRWKQLEELEKQRIDQIKKDTEEARIKLEDEMQNALYEYQAEQIRQDLLRQQEELRRLEELRNKDRMRRQQDLEMRRQQDERERAQQEERRRADMMMSMRQQELARGRGPMDSQGMRGREEMMMAERYGDRMPDRMPDRLGDRMPERMGDRMGPGQPGFMWDDKQRGEGGMRGEGGRGRDMRGSGAPPLQPPPVPPSAMGALDRGGPAAAAAAAVAQNAKSSPKPLMQSGGFGGMGGPGQQGGGGGPNNLPGGSEGGNAMDRDCAVENDQTMENDAEESAHTEISPESPEMLTDSRSSTSCPYKSPRLHDGETIVEEVTDKNSSMSQTEKHQTEPMSESDSVGISEALELWQTDVDYRLGKEAQPVVGRRKSSSERKSPHIISEFPCNGSLNDALDSSVELQDVDYRPKRCNSSSNCSLDFANNDAQRIVTRCRSEERYVSTNLGCDEPLRPKSIDCNQREAGSVLMICSNTGNSDEYMPVPALPAASEKNCRENHDSIAVKEVLLGDESVTETFVADKDNQLYISPCSTDKEDSVADRIGISYESSNSHDNEDDRNESSNNSRVVIQRYLSSDGGTNHHLPVIIQSEDSYQSSDAADLNSVVSQVEDSYLSATSSTPYLTTSNTQGAVKPLKAQTSNSVDSYVSSPPDQGCSSSAIGKCLNGNLSISNTVDKEFVTSPSTYDEAGEESGYTQSVEEYKSIDSAEYKQSTVDDEYKQTLLDNDEASLEGDGEAHYKQTDKSEAAMAQYQQSSSSKDISSYKQHSGDDVEEMDTEALDEDDAARISVSPSIYQSYEEDIMASHYQTAAMAGVMNVTNMSDTYSVDNRAWGSGASVGGSVSLAKDSQMPTSDSYSSSATYTLTQNTMTEAASSSSKDNVITNPSSSTTGSLSSGPKLPSGSASEEDHEGALCTGDQSFKSAAARQSALVPFMQTARSLPYVSGISPSMYAGPAMVQGINGPSVMTSSSVHIAQHPGGATIMRHQSMSAGLNGGMAQATVMQQQAMPNGVQATAMLQQRTLTNGGQTMVLQQRTMTTGLGAMTQQTVVQQRMAAPGGVAQAAMFHANAMRRQAMASQQANMMQQRAVRLVQARVMGNPMLRAQTLGGAALIHRGPSTPATLIGSNLVRGVSQGSVMQQLVRQRYLGGPVTPGRGVQMVAGRPVRVKMTYPREGVPMESNMS